MDYCGRDAEFRDGRFNRGGTENGWFSGGLNVAQCPPFLRKIKGNNGLGNRTDREQGIGDRGQGRHRGTETGASPLVSGAHRAAEAAATTTGSLANRARLFGSQSGDCSLRPPSCPLSPVPCGRNRA